jgi:FkbM family methyltransferase
MKKLYLESIKLRHVGKIKNWIFKKITKNSLPLFMKNKDAISFSPQIHGFHEPRVKALIDDCADIGFNQFLLDIGANIGLTTCQSGNKFTSIHCFEPNPLVFPILEINTKISISKNVCIYKFGLGVDDGSVTLKIPKQNWGGAFIKDSHNSYDSNILSYKDGINSDIEDNYLNVDISVRNAESALRELFSNLQKENLSKGFIKIDVEGYEQVILSALAKTIPDEFECFVIFECFNLPHKKDELEILFSNRAETFNLARIPMTKENKFKRVFQIIRNGGYYHILKEYSIEDKANDIVLKISKSKKQPT